MIQRLTVCAGVVSVRPHHTAQVMRERTEYRGRLLYSDTYWLLYAQLNATVRTSVGITLPAGNASIVLENRSRSTRQTVREYEPAS